MDWFNLFGFAFITLIMIPNVIYAITCKDNFQNKLKNNWVEIIEQIGRIGCIAFMIFNIPKTWFGWQSNETFSIYLILNSILIILYLFIWTILWKKENAFKSLALSIIPSIIFLFSGIISRSILLTVSSLLFAPSHILISYKNIK